MRGLKLLYEALISLLFENFIPLRQGNSTSSAIGIIGKIRSFQDE